MKPLFIFETPEKSKSSAGILLDRISDHLLPLLIEQGFKCEIHTIPALGMTPFIKVTRNKKSVLILPWVRSYSTSKTITRILNDYPRLNILPKYKNENDETKIKAMYDLVCKYRLHFLVMLVKQGGVHTLFWLDSYENIPIEHWKTTYREKDKPKDRIHFPSFDNQEFFKKGELKNKLLKYMRNENQ